MIALDTNILVYAHRDDSPFYAPARRILLSLAEGVALWAIPWPCAHEFLTVITHPRIYAPPTPLPKALEHLDVLMESPTLRLLAEAEPHWPTLRSLLAAGRIAGPQVHDARVAALCLQHGVSELWSADRDFSRFPQLRAVNPLVAPGQD